MDFHEIANAFPMMIGKEFDELVEDIRKNGLLMPITTLDDKILDGRNRQRACEKVSVSPHYTPFVAKMSPIDFVISTNLVRRQLTTSQRAAAAAELASLKHGSNQFQSKEETPNGASSQKVSKTEAAKKLNVSKRTVVRAEAVKKADPALFNQVKAGKVSVGAAEKKVRSRKPETYTGALMPGQTIGIEKSKPQPTRDSRILAAINSGSGMNAAAKEVTEAEELSFGDHHLKELIDLLKDRIKSCREMQRALEAHYDRRKVNV
jgi:hypothetical protein